MVLCPQIFEGHIRVLYDLGDGEQQLVLSGPPASDGQWHTVNAKRILQQMTLTLDGGEGRNYNFSRGNPQGKVNLIIQRLIFAGASVSYSQEIRVLTGDLTDSKQAWRGSFLFVHRRMEAGDSDVFLPPCLESQGCHIFFFFTSPRLFFCLVLSLFLSYAFFVILMSPPPPPPVWNLRAVTYLFLFIALI